MQVDASEIYFHTEKRCSNCAYIRTNMHLHYIGTCPNKSDREQLDIGAQNETRISVTAVDGRRRPSLATYQQLLSHGMYVKQLNYIPQLLLVAHASAAQHRRPGMLR
jgi:hypothetical protein